MRSASNSSSGVTRLLLRRYPRQVPTEVSPTRVRRFPSRHRRRARNAQLRAKFRRANVPRLRATRSEEHTSELQSRLHLVCRLLLENTKNHADPPISSQTASMRHLTKDYSWSSHCPAV